MAQGDSETPSLWTATRHCKGVIVEDLEASQSVDNKSTHAGVAVELHYRRGCRLPSGTGDRWSGLRALDTAESLQQQASKAWVDEKSA